MKLSLKTLTQWARIELSGRALTYHVQHPGFNSQQVKKKKKDSQVRHIPVNLAPERLRQEDHEFKPSLG